MAEFAGKVVLVTGASTGLGRQAALSFAEAGARLVLADVETVRGEETAHAVAAMGGEVMFLRTDVSRSGDVENLVAEAVRKFGRLDCAFNNAGIAQRGKPVAELSEEDWDRAIAVNLKGVWLCLKYECAQMLKQGGGAIVNTSSIMGLVSGPGLSAYSASKSGVLGLTRSVALDYATSGIRVNAVCPGGIANTAITSRADTQDAMESLKLATPMGRLGEPDDIANAVMWLCSPASRYITGQALTIDGGFTAW
jgi:NAD(P)-dependent dehydrogenase (short-subunit alcohol dehydrogenase family)